MSDLISRQGAIEVLCRIRCGDKAKGCPAHSCLFVEEYDALPSAETHDKRTETHGVCSDLIRRSDAMGAVQDHFNADGFKGYNDGQQMMDRINSLPSAEPPYQYSEAYVNQLRGERDILQDMVDNMAEPKTGEWIQKDMYADRFCSECNYAVWDSEAEEYNFCPNCGAKMLGEDGEA